ncbi:MAG: hypothetical protein AB2693_11570 [Candidatus Thiodiazotropha sp.]
MSSKTLFAYFGKKRPLEDSQSESEPDSKSARISENGEIQACDAATPSKTTPNTISSEKNATPSKVRTFDKNWLKEFLWLRYDEQESKMFCKDCDKSGKRNAMTKGCATFQKNALNRHAETSDHKESVRVQPMQNKMQSVLTAAKQEDSSVLAASVMTVYYMATENLANRKFESLMNLQKLNGAPVKDFYKHHDSVDDMQ